MTDQPLDPDLDVAVFADPLLRDALADVIVSRTREGDYGEDVEYGVLAIEDPDVVTALVRWSDARVPRVQLRCPLCGSDVSIRNVDRERGDDRPEGIDCDGDNGPCGAEWDESGQPR